LLTDVAAGGDNHDHNLSPERAHTTPFLSDPDKRRLTGGSGLAHASTIERGPSPAMPMTVRSGEGPLLLADFQLKCTTAALRTRRLPVFPPFRRLCTLWKTFSLLRCVRPGSSSLFPPALRVFVVSLSLSGTYVCSRLVVFTLHICFPLPDRYRG